MLENSSNPQVPDKTHEGDGIIWFDKIIKLDELEKIPGAIDFLRRYQSQATRQLLLKEKSPSEIAREVQAIAERIKLSTNNGTGSSKDSLINDFNSESLSENNHDLLLMAQELATTNIKLDAISEQEFAQQINELGERIPEDSISYNEMWGMTELKDEKGERMGFISNQLVKIATEGWSKGIIDRYVVAEGDRIRAVVNFHVDGVDNMVFTMVLKSASLNEESSYRRWKDSEEADCAIVDKFFSRNLKTGKITNLSSLTTGYKHIVVADKSDYEGKTVEQRGNGSTDSISIGEEKIVTRLPTNIRTLATFFHEVGHSKFDQLQITRNGYEWFKKIFDSATVNKTEIGGNNKNGVNGKHSRMINETAASEVGKEYARQLLEGEALRDATAYLEKIVSDYKVAWIQ